MNDTSFQLNLLYIEMFPSDLRCTACDFSDHLLIPWLVEATLFKPVLNSSHNCLKNKNIDRYLMLNSTQRK